MRKVFLLMMMLLPIMASAQCINGIWYNLSGAGAEVISPPDGEARYTGNIVIPSSITYEGIGYSVTSIGSWAFRGCSALTSVAIPSSVTSIGNAAFTDCPSLTKVELNCNAIVSKDYDNPFAKYTFGEQVQEYILGESVTGIGSCTFPGCSELKSLTIGDNVTSIGSWAFRDCPALMSVTIGNSVTSIGDNAFDCCSSLTSVTIPNSVTSIGGEAFGSSGLTSVTIPNSVTSIGWKAFALCHELASANIGNSVESIGSEAFWGCSSLTSVAIPSSVTSIGNAAFTDCPSLTKVELNCNAIVSKDYDNPFAKYTFGEQVQEYILGESVTGIGSYTFPGCSELKSLTIGDNVTSIGGDAFANSDKLIDVICNATTVPETDSRAFGDSHRNATLHVPAASLTYYQKTAPWNEFKNMKSITQGIGNVSAHAVQVQSEGGMLSVSDVPVGTVISIYDLAGKLLGSAKVSSETTTIATSLRRGEVVIVKIGGKSMKFVVK